MHQNELVNILSAARADMRRHRERLAHLLARARREQLDVDRREAAEVDRLLEDILRELDEAITQRDLRR